MLEQYCSPSKQCNNNVVTPCCAENRRCVSSHATSRLEWLAALTDAIFMLTDEIPLYYYFFNKFLTWLFFLLFRIIALSSEIKILPEGSFVNFTNLVNL